MRVFRAVLWMLTAATMIAIFLLSAQSADESNAGSVIVTETIINTLPATRNLPETEKQEVINNTNNTVRKNAHFAMYFLLGLFITPAMMLRRQSAFPARKRLWLWGAALLICLLYAVSDEIHQIFVDGRACLAQDVLIDFSGAFLASGIVMGIMNCHGLTRILDCRGTKVPRNDGNGKIRENP